MLAHGLSWCLLYAYDFNVCSTVTNWSVLLECKTLVDVSVPPSDCAFSWAGSWLGVKNDKACVS